MEQRIYRALIVDDEPPIRDAVARAMASESFWCETAADGREAMNKYRLGRHDLVVTDLRMPGTHGHALTTELLRDENPPRVVVLTGVAEPLIVRDLLSRGVEDVIQKPVDMGVFATKMAAIFQRGAWRDAHGSSQQVASQGAEHQMVAKIEASLEVVGLCVPEALDPLFRAASDALPDPPEAMIQYMERLFEASASSQERRRTSRIPMLKTVVAIPVSRKLAPVGEALKMVARDLSSEGMRLLHTRATPSGFLAIRWPSLKSPRTFLKAAMQVSRCRAQGPFYEVAGQFVMHD